MPRVVVAEFRRDSIGKLMSTRSYAAFVMLLSAASAHAQQSQPDSSARAQVTTSIFGIDDAALAGSARASKLIGSKVYTGDTSVGQIEDVLVTLHHATVTAVILSVGGFLGIGDKLVAVPVNQIRVGPEARFITNLTKEQLANAPAFDFGKLK
jgi:sporulation protein YlmC with PRC-barrel domain